VIFYTNCTHQLVTYARKSIWHAKKLSLKQSEKVEMDDWRSLDDKWALEQPCVCGNHSDGNK